MLANRLNGIEDGNHTFWFAHFLKPINGILLIAGGILACILPIQLGLTQGDPLTSIGVVALIIFIPLSIYVYFEARNIQNRFQEIFSDENENFAGLFVEKDKYSRFLRVSRRRIFAKNEYYFSFLGSFGISLPISYILDLIRGTKLEFYLQSLQRTPVLVTVANAYVVLYWVFVESILLSVVWVILGMTVALYDVGKERINLEITKSNKELRKIIHEAKEKGISRLHLESADLSFGRLKWGLLPLTDFVFMLSLKIAVVGLFTSVPAILYYMLSPGKNSAVVWYGTCSFIGVLSFIVFIIAQLGTYRIWNDSKDETLVLLEQLCDKVKFECIKSIFSSRDPRSRENTENLEKDTNFIRTTIDDLKKLECTHFTVSSVGKLLGAVILPFVPLIVYKLLG